MNTATLQITVPTTITKRHYVAIEQNKLHQMQKRLSELEHAVQIITRGDKEYRNKKTRRVTSLAELL
ncbi:MAG: hypothetical protein HYV33_02885 [Candidatus Kerfeldbacteria bacterium]|nr:hypothetical protein [Candidatus Kerfeldbacteria bacterium]